ncbi:phospholipase/carboxylesterase [Formivibrio citricus]|uniref:Phospholipase/carboxylesterase n=1 Tax=Formivibrio citricus TaxID=83765 RepID=A0A1I4V2Y6_9NEIS|nr:alpha/beta hydrolase [Formivibrio citricus]SFM95483.1 phospholipase/carboxylesterase [Formivibrio citricus]
MSALETIEIATGDNPTASVIWLHGLGADGNDFVPVVPELPLEDEPAIRFIFPHAPVIPITCNNGYRMRGWYDIVFFEQINREADLKGIERSIEAVRALIKQENERGIPSERIVLAGFSQGGAIAYSCGLTHPEKLAGIVALSTYMPAPEYVVRNKSAANQATPIFAAHGTMDTVVPPLLGRAAHDQLKEDGYNISWQTYPMPHSVCMPEILAIGGFINQCLAA